MIQSMTGYGKTVVAYKEKKIHVEVKSLNSKSLDLSTRISPLYREKEMEIRQKIAKALIRGKIDFSIWIEKEAGTDATPINTLLVENYYRQIKDRRKPMIKIEDLNNQNTVTINPTDFPDGTKLIKYNPTFVDGAYRITWLYDHDAELFQWLVGHPRGGIRQEPDGAGTHLLY